MRGVARKNRRLLVIMTVVLPMVVIVRVFPRFGLAVVPVSVLGVPGADIRPGRSVEVNVCVFPARVAVTELGTARHRRPEGEESRENRDGGGADTLHGAPAYHSPAARSRVAAMSPRSRIAPLAVPIRQGHGEVAGNGPFPCGRDRRRPDPPHPPSSRRRPGSNAGKSSPAPGQGTRPTTSGVDVGRVPPRGVDGLTCRHRAGIQWWKVGRKLSFRPWIPACAGMTSNGKRSLLDDRVETVVDVIRHSLGHPGAGRDPMVEGRAEAVFPALDPRLRGDDIEWEVRSPR